MENSAPVRQRPEFAAICLTKILKRLLGELPIMRPLIGATLREAARNHEEMDPRRNSSGVRRDFGGSVDAAGKVR